MNESIHDFRPVLVVIAMCMILLPGCSRIRPQWDYKQKGHEYISQHRLSGNGIVNTPQILEYGLKQEGDYYKGWLTISTESGLELWQHDWCMNASDLNELMETEGGEQEEREVESKLYVKDTDACGITISDWVENIFSGRLQYGVEMGAVKLTAESLNEDYMIFYAKRFNTTEARLRDEILAQPSLSRIAYRSTWREDYNELVYVPSINHYIMYGNGSY